MSRSWPALLLLTLGIAAGGVAAIAGASPAWASCAAEPSQSPYSFTGTVVSTTNADRTAVVRTDDGRVVTVRGTDAEGPDAHTSVDRSYRVGVRYEFDPVNGSSPYQDSICSTTHPIDALGTAAPSAGAPHRSDSGIGRTAVWATGALVVVLSLWFLGGLVWRAMKRAT
jgi:hypothetical protein